MQPGDIFTDYEQRMQRLPVFDNLESDNAKALPMQYRSRNGNCRGLITSQCSTGMQR